MRKGDMAEDREQGQEQPAGPAPLRLKVVTDGDPANTKLVNAETGEEVRVEGHAFGEVEGDPKRGGRASVYLVFPEVEVDASQAPGPFLLHGVTFGHAAVPDGTSLRGASLAPARSTGAPQEAPPAPSPVGGPGASGPRDPDNAKRANQKANQGG
jgi:hypothetical protein